MMAKFFFLSGFFHIAYPNSMGLSKQAIREFKKIYYLEFGERISDKQALDMAEDLLSLFRIIGRFIPKQDRQEWEIENRPHKKDK